MYSFEHSFRQFKRESISPEYVPVAVVGVGVVEEMEAAVHMNFEQFKLDEAWWSVLEVIAARSF